VSIAVVYDTMLFLQVASRPDRLHITFRAVKEGRATLFISAELLAEIQDVLNRKNMRVRFPGLTPQAVEVFIADVLSHSTVNWRRSWPSLPQADLRPLSDEP
jgi:hypothetical protein